MEGVGLKKSLDNLQAVREKFQTITSRFAAYQAQWLNVHVDFPLLQRIALATTKGSSDATAQAITQAPLAMLGALFATPGGTTTALKAARIVGRNWPLALLLVMIGVLFWPTEGDGAIADSAEPARKPDGADPLETYH